nr:reverse transcriptase domain-containing protein [Tanacetum cinerariifolium]
MKQNRVSDDALRLFPFPYSLTHHAIAWYDRLPRNSIHSFDDMMRKFLSKYFPPSMVTKLRNEITKFKQKPHESLFEAWERYKLSVDQCPNHNMLLVTQIDTFYNGLTLSHRDTINAAEDLKAITTRSGVTLAGPSVSPPSPLSKEVDQEPETITDQVLTGSTNNVPPLAVQLSFTSSTPILFPKIPEVTKHTIWVQALTLCLFQFGKKLSLPELTGTQMILELADRSTTRPAGIAEDVFVKVGKFHFLTNFVVVDYVVDPRVPLILGRPFLRTGRALIDVYGEDLTLRVDDEAITFKVSRTSKYSYNDAESINRIDVIDVACEEYVQEVLGFSDKSKSGNPTLISNLIIALSSPSLTPFEGGDFILKEIEACLTSKSIPSRIDDTNLDLEGDIRLLEELMIHHHLLSLRKNLIGRN